MKLFAFVAVFACALLLAHAEDVSAPTVAAPVPLDKAANATNVAEQHADDVTSSTLVPDAKNPTLAPETTIPSTVAPNATVVPEPTTTTTTTNAPTTTNSTVDPPTTTPQTTVAPDNSTTVVPPTTTSTVVPPTPTPAPHRHFDGPSFCGGIALTLGLIAIGFVVFKYMKSRTEQRNYHTL